MASLYYARTKKESPSNTLVNARLAKLGLNPLILSKPSRLIGAKRRGNAEKHRRWERHKGGKNVAGCPHFCFHCYKNRRSYCRKDWVSFVKGLGHFRPNEARQLLNGMESEIERYEEDFSDLGDWRN